MVELRGLQMFFSLMTLILQLLATEVQDSDVPVRVGDEVTLSCGNVKDDQDKCNSTTWLFTTSRKRSAVTLFENGKMHANAKNKSPRLSVTVNCSLVINVTAEDVGDYTCRMFNKSGKQEGPDFINRLSPVNMSERREGNTVTLTCSVYEQCPYTVKWLYEDKPIDKNNTGLKTSQSACSASVTFTTSHNVYTSKNYDLFKCQVKNDDDDNTKEFTFRIQLPGMKTEWWKVIAALVGVVALLISVVVVIFIQWKKFKENRLQTREFTADPEDTVRYASITFTKSTTKTLVLAKNGRDEDEAVTYSMVKASSCSYPKPLNLYATINSLKQ